MADTSTTTTDSGSGSTSGSTTSTAPASDARRTPEPLVSSQTLGDVLKAEGDKNLTRAVATLKSGTKYVVGMLLAKDGDKYKEAKASDTAEAVVIFEADATDEDQVATILVRGPSGVAEAGLVFADDVNTDAKKVTKHNQLADAGIVVLVSA